MTEDQSLRDYVKWHEDYQDPNSDLSVRLRHVQRAISEYFDTTSGPVRVLSSCAGQGDDILGVLRDRPELRERTSGVLIELHPVNAQVARERVAELGVDITVIEGDASVTDTYRDGAPADLLLLNGIMGNISPEDIHRLIATAPMFCASGATVIWTRGIHTGNINDQIRAWFTEAGFTEVSYDDDLEGTTMRVGVQQLTADPQPFREGVHLFTFFR